MRISETDRSEELFIEVTLTDDRVYVNGQEGCLFVSSLSRREGSVDRQSNGEEE